MSVGREGDYYYECRRALGGGVSSVLRTLGKTPNGNGNPLSRFRTVRMFRGGLAELGKSE